MIVIDGIQDDRLVTNRDRIWRGIVGVGVNNTAQGQGKFTTIGWDINGISRICRNEAIEGGREIWIGADAIGDRHAR